MTATNGDDVIATRDTMTPGDTGRAVVSLDTAAAIVGCSRRTLQRAIQRGELDRIEVEGRAVIARDALDAWAATRDTRHVAGMTHTRQSPRDTPRHDAPDVAAVRVAALEVEVAALRERAAYAERIADERQRTIDALTGAVARLTLALDSGAAPVEVVRPAQQQEPANTVDAAVSDSEARSATIPPSVGVETSKGHSRRPRWWPW